MEEPDFYNPLDKINLGKSVVDALLSRPSVCLADLPKFSGAGIYAVYYSGDFKAYAPLADLNRTSSEYPIYVGKATPRGGRKGASAIVSNRTTALFRRIQEHEASIRAVKSLNVNDFQCRYLVVDDIWISLGESLVIDRFRPLWNVLVEGFGNHDPGTGRYGGRRPLWDELHPGRAWAIRCSQARLSAPEIEQQVSEYMDWLSTRVDF